MGSEGRKRHERSYSAMVLTAVLIPVWVPGEVLDT